MIILLEELEKLRVQQGYISEEDIRTLAKQMDVPSAGLYGVISFYSRFHTKPQGKYIIRICKSVVCGMNGSREVRKAIQDHLEIEPGETTIDGLFTLELMECLGQCSQSPAMTVNDKVYGNLTPSSAVDVIREYQMNREVQDV